VVSSTAARRAPAWQTLAGLLEYRSQHQAERKAFTFLENGDRESESVTYRELGLRARQVGAELQRMGASGERVVLIYPSGLEFIAAFFGCHYAGASAVPVLPARHGRAMERLQSIIKDADPAVVLTTAALLKTVTAQLNGQRSRIVCTTGMFNGVEPDSTPSPCRASDVAILQYTSGSTGSPKGVMVTHSNVLHNQKAIYELFEHTEESVMVSWLPVFHDMGLIGMILQPIYVGCSGVLMSPGAFLQDPRRWLRVMTRYGGTTTGAPNFAYDICVDRIPEHERSEFDLGRWLIAYNGAEPIRASTLERFTAAYAPYGFRPETFYPCYGLAEATLLVTGSRPCDPPFVRTESHLVKPLVGCGRCHDDQRILTVDPESCIPVGKGQIGEIWISGQSVTAGYWHRPEETKATFGAHVATTGEGPFLRTGDLGLIVDGELYVTGRLKEIMIVRGRNHYPQDIEQTAERGHPALRPGCGAAFLADSGAGEQLVVVQELRKEYLDDPPVSEIARRVREAVALEHGLQVAALVLLRTGTLPKTSSGKIQRRLCHSYYLEGRLAKVAADPEVN
jgi:acyl-CoA synthetase (AMP-forming)/AMP-acid ligase II